MGQRRIAWKGGRYIRFNSTSMPPLGSLFLPIHIRAGAVFTGSAMSDSVTSR
jgi:hypothetical protein